MSEPEPITSRPAELPTQWTQLEDYLDLGRLWRRAAQRHRRRIRPRTELSAPGLLSLGMLPFLLLMAGMALLSLCVIVAAVPGQHRADRPPEPPPLGTAPPGWLKP